MAKIQEALAELEVMYTAIPADAYDLDNVCNAGEDAIDAVLFEIDAPTPADEAKASECGTAASKLRVIALINLDSLDPDDAEIVEAENAVANELGFSSAKELIEALFAEGTT